MENLLSLSFEAHNADKNHHRRYGFMIGRDLFGHWTVSVRYGRTGAVHGRELHYCGLDAEPLRVIIRDRLLRRLSAPTRIGCPYRLAGLSVAAGIDASFWLPADIMAQFV
ncbi:MAG: WGR domain-containing protein [Bryobacteraceae bacterium]